MRYTVILRYIGTVMFYISMLMFVASLMSLWNSMDSGFYALLLSSLLTLVLSLFPFLFVPRAETITNKEGFVIVVGSWLLACIVGTFPYLIWGGEFSLMNAWFESVSGFTASGATILKHIENLPQGLLFWRTCTNWVGGVGVVMFALVILPSLGINKMALTSVELSSLSKDNYRYRTQVIIRILLCVYLGITAITTLLLKAAGMRWFDALNHAMSVCATGGFSTKDTSIAYFDSPVIELILMGAMFISSLHIGLIYTSIVSRSNFVFRNEVVRTYILVCLLGIVMVSLSLFTNNVFETPLECLRKGAFQFMSIITTTGFATADTSVWPPLAVVMLIFASIVCATAGSTSGGMKIDRLLVCLKEMQARVKNQQHPNAIIRIRLNGILQENSTMHMVMVFIASYLFLILLGTVCGTIFGMDMITSFSSAVACIGNVGPGFGQVGSMSCYSEVPALMKLIDTVLMLMGRLEIFGFIQFLLIKWWH